MKNKAFAHYLDGASDRLVGAGRYDYAEAGSIGDFMTERNIPWPAGTPCWVDCQTPNLDIAIRFYETVFGWQVEPEDSQDGDYRVCKVNGLAVAGIRECLPRIREPMWVTYLATDDLDAALERAADLGGDILVPNLPVGDAGKAAILSDPGGATFGLWQAERIIGANLCNVPGTLRFNELVTTDLARAKSFYGALFDLTFTPGGPGQGDSFVWFSLAGSDKGIGSMQQVDGANGTSSRWRTMFDVYRTDPSIATITAAGGVVIGDPADTPFGRTALIRGPQGETFGLIDESAAMG